MTTTTDPTPVADPRPAFTAATRVTLDVALGLFAEDLDRPTPCADFDVATLRGHLLTVFRRIAHVGRGGAPFDVPHVTLDVDADRVDDALRAAADDAVAVWADSALLTRPVTHPIGVLPGGEVLATYVGELTTHAWDLAVAVGRPLDVDPDVVAVGARASHALLPPGRRPEGFPFGDEVPAPDDATPIEMLVAWQGRDPRWKP